MGFLYLLLGSCRLSRGRRHQRSSELLHDHPVVPDHANGGVVALFGKISEAVPDLLVSLQEVQEVLRFDRDEGARVGDTAHSRSHFSVVADVFDTEEIAHAGNHEANVACLPSLTLEKRVVFAVRW